MFIPDNETPEIDLSNFTCLRCGRCCTWGGFCRVSDGEIEKIAAYLQIDVKEFIDQYTDLAPDRHGLILKDKRQGVCIFYEDDPPGCKIHPVKPVQCDTFPEQWNMKEWYKICEWGRQNVKILK